MPKQEFDDQGKYFWHLAKYAGWTEQRVNSLLLKCWQATHWNALERWEKRAAINMMRAYAKKKDNENAKKLRQSIMALVSKNGKDISWLHEQMAAWGAGDSLRKLSYADTVTVYEAVKARFPGQRVPGGDSAVIEDGVSYEYSKLKGDPND